MYKVTLEIADDDLRFLRERAPLYGKASAAEVLQLLVNVMLRGQQLDERNAEGSLRELGLRYVVLHVPEDQYLAVKAKAERKGKSPESELESLLWNAIGDAELPGGEPARS